MLEFKMTLQFDSAAARAWIEAETRDVIESLCALILETARANLGWSYAEVESTLRIELLNLAERGLHEGRVTSDHWQAWIAEWGSGTLMDPNNPALSEYMSSEYWNPARRGLAITGRPAGAYKGLDGEIHDSHTGMLEGVNLEELSRNDPSFRDWMARVGLPDDAFQPKPALHFMREAILSNRNFIIDQFNAVIERFPIADFLR